MIDSQSVKADAVVGADSRGFDGGKLINGRKRHVVVDTLGLLLGVMVTAADVGDRTAAKVLLGQVTGKRHRLELAAQEREKGAKRTTRPTSWTSHQPKSAVCWQLDPATAIHPATTR